MALPRNSKKCSWSPGFAKSVLDKTTGAAEERETACSLAYCRIRSSRSTLSLYRRKIPRPEMQANTRNISVLQLSMVAIMQTHSLQKQFRKAGRRRRRRATFDRRVEQGVVFNFGFRITERVASRNDHKERSFRNPVSAISYVSSRRRGTVTCRLN
jgi:hypothetical protein